MLHVLLWTMVSVWSFQVGNFIAFLLCFFWSKYTCIMYLCIHIYKTRPSWYSWWLNHFILEYIYRILDNKQVCLWVCRIQDTCKIPYFYISLIYLRPKHFVPRCSNSVFLTFSHYNPQKLWKAFSCEKQ